MNKAQILLELVEGVAGKLGTVAAIGSGAAIAKKHLGKAASTASSDSEGGNVLRKAAKGAMALGAKGTSAHRQMKDIMGQS